MYVVADSRLVVDRLRQLVPVVLLCHIHLRRKVLRVDPVVMVNVQRPLKARRRQLVVVVVVVHRPAR